MNSNLILDFINLNSSSFEKAYLVVDKCAGNLLN